MKFKYEPAMILYSVNVAVGVLLAFHVINLTADQSGAVLTIATAITTGITAAITRPVVVPTLVAAASTAAVAVGAFGLHISDKQLSASTAALTLILGLLLRQQVTPQPPQYNAGHHRRGAAPVEHPDGQHARRPEGAVRAGRVPVTTPVLPKLGLRRTDPERLRNTIRLTLTGAVPPHPLVADNLSKVLAWNGATNYQYGTCGPCSVANSVIATWQYLKGEAISVSDAAIFDLYRRSGNPDFDPDTGQGDNGVDMTVMLSALVKGGITITRADGTTEVVKPLCFAAAPTAIDDLRAVTAIFGGVDVAVTLQTAQQAQTDAGLWDYSRSPEWGGHAIWGGLYTSKTGAGQSDETIITWEQLCGTTDLFVAHQLDEAYVIVWQPLWDTPVFEAGVDQAALAADYTALTGKTIPVPVPPTPVPPPVPPGPAPGITVDSADRALGSAEIARVGVG